MNEYERSVSEICVSYCMQCIKTCNETKAYCIISGRNFGKLIFMLEDCIKVCSLTSDLIINHSFLMNAQIGICIKMCDRLAEECNKFDDSVLRNCADFSLSCSDCCKSLLELGWNKIQK